MERLNKSFDTNGILRQNQALDTTFYKILMEYSFELCERI